MMIFYDNKEIIEQLPGDLIKTALLDILEYGQNGVVPPKYDNLALNIVISAFKASVDRGKEISKSRSESGRIGGKASASKRKQTQANASNREQEQPITHNNTHNTHNTHNTTHSPLPPHEGGVGESAQDSGFAQFWEAYPRKESRERAFAEWVSLSPNGALLAQMLDAIELQKCSTEWQREGGRYIPHAANWIKDRRWEDEAMPQCNDSGGTFDTETFFKDALAKVYDTPNPE